MTVLLTDSPSYWPTNRLTQVRSYSITRSLTKWLSAWKTVLLTDYLTDWLSYWLTVLLTDYLTDWLTDWLTDYLTDWFTARLSWWLTISATYLLKNRQILMAKWLTDWMTIDEPTDWRTNERNRRTDRPMDGLTTDGLTDLDWRSDRWMNDRNLLWLTGHVWPLKSPWLTKMTYYLTYSLAYWLTGWMINPTSSGRNNFVPLTILLKDRLKKSGLGMVRIT